MEFKVETLQTLKSLENDQRYGKVYKNALKLWGSPGQYSFSLHWLILHHAFVTLISLYIDNILWSKFRHFHLSWQTFLQAVVAKLLNETASQYPLADCLSFLDVQLIADRDKNKTRLKSVLCLLVQCNRVHKDDMDEILRQYSEYTTVMLDSEWHLFVNLDPIKSRMDSLMHETLTSKDVYRKLRNVIGMLLVLPHGQATVERGFSIMFSSITYPMHVFSDSLTHLKPNLLPSSWWGWTTACQWLVASHDRRASR